MLARRSLSSLCRTAALAALFANPLGCAGPTPDPEPVHPDGKTPPAQGGEVGAIQLELATVPPDVRCVRAIVTSPQMVIRTADQSPGSTASLSFTGLPLGPCTLYFDAFDQACSSVTAGLAPTWVATRAVTVQLQPAFATPVSVILQRPGRVSGMVDFQGATFAFDPPSQNLGDINIGGGSSTASFTIFNVSGTTLTYSPSLTGPNKDEFIILTTSCGATLAPNTACGTVVRFEPTSVGPKSAAFAVGNVSATITANAIPPVPIVYEPVAPNFGNVAIGQSVQLPITVRNRGTAPVAMMPLLGGTNKAEFAFAANTCGSSLAAGATCTVTMKFQPTSVGSKQAVLTVDNVSFVVLFGNAVAGGAVTVSPTNLDYGNVTVGSSSMSVAFKVTNGSGAAVSIAPQITGGDATAFAITSSTCTATLAASASCTVNAQFKPTSTGMKFATLRINADVNAILNGTGVSGGGFPISNLVVNDTASAGWTIQTNFSANVLAFTDRDFMIQSVGSLGGRNWIRTAADSKSFAASPTLATFTLTGTAVYLIVDDRYTSAGAPTWLNGWTNTGIKASILESGTGRSHTAWKQTFTSGSTVTLPKIGSTTAPCYLVVVE